MPLLATKTPKIKIHKTIDFRHFLENKTLKSGVYADTGQATKKLKGSKSALLGIFLTKQFI